MDRHQKIALIIIIGFLIIISLIYIQTEERTRQYKAENVLDTNGLPKTQANVLVPIVSVNLHPGIKYTKNW